MRRITSYPLLVQGQLFCLVQALFEFVNTAACIYELLFARKEGVALGANFNTHIALCGTSLNFCAASTLNGAFFIFGLNSCFHCTVPLFVRIFTYCIVL